MFARSLVRVDGSARCTTRFISFDGDASPENTPTHTRLDGCNFEIPSACYRDGVLPEAGEHFTVDTRRDDTKRNVLFVYERNEMIGRRFIARHEFLLIFFIIIADIKISPPPPE